MVHDVFISYASEDKDIAHAICNILEQHEIKCWIAPRDVLLGESYAGSIIKAIHQTHLLVLVLSTHADKSPHVERELESALGKRLPLLSFRIENVELSDSMQYFIRVKQGMDAFDPPMEKHLSRLTAAVKQWLAVGESQSADANPQPEQVLQARPRGPQRIVTQAISVSYINAGKGRDGLVFRQAPLTMEQAPPVPSYSRVPWTLIRNHLQDINVAVREVTRSALLRQPMGNSGIEGALATLSHYVLPKQGFVGMLLNGVHPELDIVPDAAADIPWELLEDNYGSCANRECAKSAIPQCSAISLPGRCQECGAPLQRACEKLGLMYHLSFLTRGNAASTTTGNRFLVISDPTGELCDIQHDPKGVSAQHLRELNKSLQDRGYEVETLAGADANISRVRAAIANPALAGIYYFGADGCSVGDSKDSLLLADAALRAGEITSVMTSAQLVFLNMCARRRGPVSGYQRRVGGIASAFTGGNAGKVVIIPTWPMAPVPAAQHALEFFRHATVNTPLGVALSHARRLSFRRYEAGEPDVGWLAYRYFGDPNRPPPDKLASTIVWEHDGSEGRPVCRVFDDKTILNSDIFSFAIDDVLLRAAKRRNVQGRVHISVTDLLTGMMRKGELTRYVVRHRSLNPDEIYEALSAQPETGPRIAEVQIPQDSRGHSDALDTDDVRESKLRALLARWVVREEGQFSPLLVELLITADESSQRHSAGIMDAPISEQDILELLVRTEAWKNASQLGVPSAVDIVNILHEIKRSEKIDRNGCVSLKGLDAAAQKIVETAHLLAQQRGAPQIPHRLLFAAFLMDSNGTAASLCRAIGIDPNRLFALMVAVTPDAPSLSFPLSLEACERAVLPAIEAAGRVPAPDSRVTEDDFFRAFCRQADPDFRMMLQSPIFKVDLDKLAATQVSPQTPLFDADASAAAASTTQPAQATSRSEDGPAAQRKNVTIEAAQLAEFTYGAQTIIYAAAQLARQQGWSVIRSPHLFAALLDKGFGPAATAGEHPGVSMEKLRQAVLELVPIARVSIEASNIVSISPNVQAVFQCAVRLAAGHHQAHATEQELLDAFFVDGGGVVGELLRRSGLNIQPLPKSSRNAPDSIH